MYESLLWNILVVWFGFKWTMLGGYDGCHDGCVTVKKVKTGKAQWNMSDERRQGQHSEVTTSMKSFDRLPLMRELHWEEMEWQQWTFKMNLREMHVCKISLFKLDFRFAIWLPNALKHWLAPPFHRGIAAAAERLIVFQPVARNQRIAVFLVPQEAVFPGIAQCRQWCWRRGWTSRWNQRKFV